MATPEELPPVPEVVAPPIIGRDWRKEVGGVGYDKAQMRRKFYMERAKFKLRTEGLKLKTQNDLDSIFDDPKARGFLAFEDIQKVSPASAPISVKADSRTTLPKILENMFRLALPPGSDARAIEREVSLSLYYLSNHERDVRGRKINVDLIRDNETIEIKDGKLTITAANGTKRIDDVFIRRPSGKIVKAAPVQLPN